MDPTTTTTRTYLVTGGTGFLGQHLVRLLLREDNTHVRVLARGPDRSLERQGAEMIPGSILDPHTLAQACEGVDGIFHLAGRVERNLDRSHVLYTLHVTGTRNVIEAAGAAGVQRIVVASTSGTVGVTTDGRTIPDDRSDHATEVVRGWPYYLSKIYAEKSAIAAARRAGVELILMRPTLLLGPGDTRLSSTRDVLNFLEGQIPIVPSGGLSFVDVRDAAVAFQIAMERGRADTTYLLGAINLTFEAFFERLESISGIQRPRLAVPNRAARFGARAMGSLMSALGQESPIDPTSVEMAQHFWYIDWSAAIQDLNFSPRDPNQTLYDTVQWLRAHQLNRPDDVPTARPGPAQPSDHDHPFAPTTRWSDSGNQWRHHDVERPTTNAYGEPLSSSSSTAPTTAPVRHNGTAIAHAKPDPMAPYADYVGQSEIVTEEDYNNGPGLEGLITHTLGGALRGLMGGRNRGSAGDHG
ncbi:MAG: NAD-dependent epimerase/dehydratase family protein, partial [Myxococcota bacterium]